jgi:hypothetical protein
MSIEEYSNEVLQWLRASSHPMLKRPYLTCGYVPMIELLRYLETNGFATYIASGGDRDFMRPFAEELYGVPPERVIGSAFGLDFQAGDDDTKLLYKSKIEFFDDGPEKPVRIWSRIGRPPLACGNSNGDVPMLRFARVDGRPSLRLLVLHDDDEREFDYTAGAEDALERARARRWTIVSTKNDWNAIFPERSRATGRPATRSTIMLESLRSAPNVRCREDAIHDGRRGSHRLPGARSGAS